MFLSKAKIATFCLLLLVAAPTSSTAQQATSPQPSSDESLEDLSRNQYSSRQRATLDMWRQREESREQVQRAARDPDPEVSGRAKWILRQWRRGSVPGAAPEVTRLLQQGDGPLAVQRLLERGQYQAAVVAVEESVALSDHEAVRSRIISALRRRFPIYIHHAIKNDTLPDLLKLIDMIADSTDLAVCRIQLMRQLGMEISDDNLLPSSAKEWPPVDRDRATALVLLTLQRTDDAIEIAARSTDKELLRQCRMIGGRWADIARDASALADQAKPGSYEHTRDWTDAMIGADRSGDRALFQRAVEQLSAPERADEESSDELRWKCLAIHGEIAHALGLLDQISVESAADVAVDASQPAHAFEVLGYPLDQVDLQLRQWIDSAIAEQQKTTTDDLVDEVRQLMALMDCLMAIGRDDAAWEIAKRLSESKVHIEALMLRDYVLWHLKTSKRPDWVLRLAVRAGETSLPQTAVQALADTVPGADAQTYQTVIEAMQVYQPDMSLQQRVLATYELLSGELPDFFEPDRDFDRLYEYVTRMPPVQRRRNRAFQVRNAMISVDLVRLFARHGQVKLATTALQQMAQSGNVEAMFQLAEQELDGGRAESSLSLFEAVFQTIESQSSAVARFGGSDDVSLAVKSLIGAWTIARRTGDEQVSAELLREIRLCLCSPSAQQRQSIADYLAERDESLLALETYEALLPLAVVGTQDNISLPGVARRYAGLARNTNTGEAARWFDLAICATLELPVYRAGGYVTLPLYIRRLQVESAIEDRDSGAIGKHLERILKLDPLDIDFAERLLPDMRKAGMNDLADSAIDQIMERGLQYAQRFPFDAMTSNNLAWVAAMNKRHLEDALRLSEMAVYVEPDSAIYRDTLAEVLFLLDRKQEALQIEQACLLDDPSEWHLHEQVEKYSAAIAGEES